MTTRFILSDYVEEAIAQAVSDKLEDGTFVFTSSFPIFSYPRRLAVWTMHSSKS
ncbi:hypothetical protein I8751_21975 [Nostocaceae cyanobacterium CENA357]|uniref:Uncharacterized protein n=1 Tax=Atlanticothrix silvestris CENA357 TaxID=1725252 RepID=A0A8J7L4M6_9CYAN|nr:hypothetical protein [Atlanticothrix silvestris]MBH8554966.1 hypothetical protein [Atlanticothrix silvestris CENA357]